MIIVVLIGAALIAMYCTAIAVISAIIERDHL